MVRVTRIQTRGPGDGNLLEQAEETVRTLITGGRGW